MHRDSLLLVCFLFKPYTHYKQRSRTRQQASGLGMFIAALIKEGRAKTTPAILSYLASQRIILTGTTIFRTLTELLRLGYVRRYRKGKTFHYIVTSKGIAALAKIEEDLQAIHERGYLYEPPKDQG
jgi:DNA-binding MarR family transcriptional regulator